MQVINGKERVRSMEEIGKVAEQGMKEIQEEFIKGMTADNHIEVIKGWLEKGEEFTKVDLMDIIDRYSTETYFSEFDEPLGMAMMVSIAKKIDSTETAKIVAEKYPMVHNRIFDSLDKALAAMDASITETVILDEDDGEKLNALVADVYYHLANYVAIIMMNRHLTSVSEPNIMGLLLKMCTELKNEECLTVPEISNYGILVKYLGEIDPVIITAFKNKWKEDMNNEKC